MYLVTGGAGFIGSHITHQLVAEGHRVRILDNLSSGTEANLAGIRNDVEIVVGDIRDREAVSLAASGVEVIFHQAAEPSVSRSVADPAAAFRTNIDGTLHVLEAARAQACRRVVFATTCAIYGDGPELPKVETLVPRPLTPYAMSKLAGEQLCAMFTRLYGVETLGLRYFNVFGPRQDPHSAYAAAIPAFVDAITSGRRPRVYGDGEQSRDFVSVSDVVRANLLAAAAPVANGQVVNVASGRSVTINQVLVTLGRTLNRPVFPDYLAARSGDIRHSAADISLARTLIGFEPKLSFEEGIALLLDTQHVLANAAAA